MNVLNGNFFAFENSVLLLMDANHYDIKLYGSELYSSTVNFAVNEIHTH